MSFKPGDLVMCLTTYGDQFTKNKIYKVKCMDGGVVMVTLDDVGSPYNGFGKHNFVLVQSGNKSHLPEFL